MRHSGPACRQCRVGKRKCDRPVGEACLPCTRRGLDCSSVIAPRTNADLRPVLRVPDETVVEAVSPTGWLPGPPRETVLGSMSSNTIAGIMEMYIKYVHDKPHSLFHIPTLRDEVRSGVIDPALLCCIMALAARFSPSEEIRALGPRLTAQAKEMLRAGLESITLARIQAWIILGNVCGAEPNSASESLFFGIAIRSAHIIDLFRPDDQDTAVRRESKSRTWWTLYMIDRWSAAGLGTPRQMGERQPSQQLPLDEYNFHGLEVGQTSWPTTPKPGLWAYMITLAETFGRIQDLNRTLASGNADEPYITSAVDAIFNTLERWQKDLPDTFRLSADMLAYHRERGQGSTFVALHLGYFHYATLLLFQYLDQSAILMPFGDVYAERCRQHASAFSDLLRTSYEFDGCEAAYNIVGHMTVVSSSVLIHTLLFGHEDHLPAAKARLESNFNILMKLKSWWPSVEGMTKRLFLFQNACLRSVDNHTHKLDRWMVKFLLEHAITLGDKPEADLLEDMSPQSYTSGEPPELKRLSERGRFTRHALSGLRS